MNKKISILVSVSLAATMLATSMSAFAYTDVSADHWAKSYVDNLSNKRYISGYEDNSFKPDAYITRAEFAKILINITGAIDKSGVSLADVSDSAWYADTMKIAVKAGYVTGYSDGTVKPEANITRQEAAVMVYRAFGLAPEGALNFADKGEIADWAANQVATLSAKNVINGYSDGTFQPNKNITRAEVAKIISAALELGIKTGSTANTTVNTGTGSGVIHVSGNNKEPIKGTTSSSGGSSGGGGGGSSSTEKAPTKPSAPTVNKDDAATTIEISLDEVAEAIKAKVDGETVKDDTQLITEIVLPDVKDTSKVTVKVDGEDDMTFEDFNRKIKDMTAAEVVEYLKKATIEYSATNEDSVKVAAKVDVPAAEEGQAPTPVITEDDEVVAPVEINYLVESLKAFAAGEATNKDLVVVAKKYTKGYTANKSAADTWLKSNAVYYTLHKELMTAVATKLDAEITADNAETYAAYYDVMSGVLDDAVDFIVSKKGKLTREESMEYFADKVEAAIKDKVSSADDAEVIITVAKNWGVSELVGKLADVNKAVTKYDQTSNKKAAVWKVFNDMRDVK